MSVKLFQLFHNCRLFQGDNDVQDDGDFIRDQRPSDDQSTSRFAVSCFLVSSVSLTLSLNVLEKWGENESLKNDISPVTNCKCRHQFRHCRRKQALFLKVHFFRWSTLCRNTILPQIPYFSISCIYVIFLIVLKMTLVCYSPQHFPSALSS